MELERVFRIIFDAKKTHFLAMPWGRDLHNCIKIRPEDVQVFYGSAAHMVRLEVTEISKIAFAPEPYYSSWCMLKTEMGELGISFRGEMSTWKYRPVLDCKRGMHLVGSVMSPNASEEAKGEYHLHYRNNYPDIAREFIESLCGLLSSEKSGREEIVKERAQKRSSGKALKRKNLDSCPFIGQIETIIGVTKHFASPKRRPGCLENIVDIASQIHQKTTAINRPIDAVELAEQLEKLLVALKALATATGESITPNPSIIAPPKWWQRLGF